MRPVSVVLHDQMDRDRPRRPRREKSDYAQGDDRPQQTGHPIILLRPRAGHKLSLTVRRPLERPVMRLWP